jgi:hypothetical protein
MSKDQPCKSCGRCPACGKGGYTFTGTRPVWIVNPNQYLPNPYVYPNVWYSTSSNYTNGSGQVPGGYSLSPQFK